MSEILLSAQSIAKSFAVNSMSTELFSDVNLAVKKGEHLSIMGASGSGKSTLLNLLAGFDTPTSGAVFFEDKNLSDLTESQQASLRRNDFGFVFQSFYLLPSLTAFENILFPLELQHYPQKTAQAKALAMLETVGLSHRAKSLPHQLSGGERQRVAIARALIHEPKILFADEPTGNLDEKNSEQVLALLMDLKQKIGTALVLITHEKEIADLGQKIFLLEGGTLSIQ